MQRYGKWGITVIAAPINLGSDKSQVSLEAGALSFYRLHIMALTSLEKSPLEEIIENRMLGAYLPFSFESTDYDDAFPNPNSFLENLWTIRTSLFSSRKRGMCFGKLLSTAVPNLQQLHLMTKNILHTKWLHLTLLIFRRLKMVLL